MSGAVKQLDDVEVAVKCSRLFPEIATTTCSIANAHGCRINTQKTKIKGSSVFDGVGASRTVLSTSSTALAA
jgi:hypothetical protein